MEDRKTAFAILLCIVVLLVYTEVVFAPYKNRPAPVASGVAPSSAQTTPLTQASGAAANGSTTVPAKTSQISASGQPVVVPLGSRPPSQEELATAGQTIIETPLVEARISSLGARLLSFKLRHYALTLGSKDLVDLVSAVDGAPLPLGLVVGDLSDERVNYSLVSASVPAADKNTYRSTGNDLVLAFEGKLSDGQVVKKTLTFKPASYLVSIKADLANLVVAKPIRLEWTHFVAPQEDQTINPEGFTRLTDQQKIESLPLLKVLEGVNPAGKSLWIGFADKYFLAALIAGNQIADSFQGKTQNIFVQGLSSVGQTVEYLAYLGPKDYSELTLSGFQLQRSIDLGVFSFLAQPLLLAMNFFHSIIGNYGLAIVLLTLLIKTLFLPLTKASFKSMRAMQDIQPEMKALRERIKDPTQLNQEMLALYKKRGVNPMGGCLPILIQLPVFLGLYNALYGAIELRQANFALWITDLSAPESLHLFGIGVPVMVLLMGLSMFLAQATTPSAADPQQKKIMLMMPVVFTIMFVIHPFPAGLVLYWLVNNLISITQQWYLRSDKKASPFHATAIAAVGIFSFAFVLTLL